MKNLKCGKAYGALEYIIVIALVIIVGIVNFNMIKGKSKYSVLIDKSLSSVSYAVGDEGWINVLTTPKKEVSVVFPYTIPKIIINGESIETSEIKTYLNSEGFIIKDIDENSTVEYEIENIFKIGEFIQFDIVVGEYKKSNIQIPFSVNEYIQWKSYPESPLSIVDYPYQFIGREYGAIHLYISSEPFYHYSDTRYSSQGSRKEFNLVSGSWQLDSNSTYLYAHEIKEANRDIFTTYTFEIVMFKATIAK